MEDQSDDGGYGGYLDRLRNDRERSQKIDVAAFVATKLLSKRPQEVFVASGTTAAMAGLHLLTTNDGVRAYTHSIPFAFHLMEFIDLKLLPHPPTVSMLHGVLNTTTGIVQADMRRRIPSKTFIYAPHGLDVSGITGDRDVQYLKSAWKVHKRIVLLATPSKLLRTGASVVKHLGHIRREQRAKARQHDLVVPQSMADLDDQQRQRVESVLSAMSDAGVTVHRAPPVKSSPILEYFKRKDRGSR